MASDNFCGLQLLIELKATSPSPMKVLCDNIVDIAIAYNPVLHDKTKHVKVDKHFTKEKRGKWTSCYAL